MSDYDEEDEFEPATAAEAHLQERLKQLKSERRELSRALLMLNDDGFCSKDSLLMASVWAREDTTDE